MSKSIKIFVFSVIIIAVIGTSTYVMSFAYTEFLKSIYPLKYENIVNEASSKYSVDSEFVLAVMKTESKFNENAVSSAGAKGLMQITPSTFQWLQKKRGISDIMPQEYLFDNKINIDYGTYFLGMLLARYKDKSVALSAYNAGIGAVDSWLNDENLSSDGETLDNIPYTQTDNYVDRVLEDEQIYKKLYFS